MEIELKASYGFYLVVKADNVNIEEDIEERTYAKLPDGKTDFRTPPKRDISTSALEQFANLLSNLIYYRKDDFDSSELIESLFDKLPSEKAILLSKELKNKYSDD